MLEVGWVIVAQFSIIGIKLALGGHSGCSIKVPLADDGIGYHMVE